MAAGEPWTDGGWTKVVPTTQVTRSNNVAKIERSIRSNGNDDMVDRNGRDVVNAMKTIQCNYGSDGEHGYMCDRECRRNQRLEWRIEHID